MKNILITGGTGLVGKVLTQKLVAKNHQVSYLSRSAGEKNGIKKYAWDIDKQTIDQEAINKADVIIHLAGANVGEGRWTAKRKKAIYDSRILSTRLLAEAIQKKTNKLEAFISASAVGIYGFSEGDEVFTEESNYGNDFLAKVTKDWEKEVDQATSGLGIRTVKLRIGVVLANEGGALPKLVQPVKLYAGAPLGSGKQVMPWIHIDDLCNQFVESIESSRYSGAYNAVAPNAATNAEFTRSIAEILRKPLWLPNVPSFVLKTLLGEMSLIALRGTNVSADKIIKTGFQFQYTDHKEALKDLLLDD